MCYNICGGVVMSDFILDEPFCIKRFIYSVNGSLKAGTQSDIPARDYDSFVLIRRGTFSYEFEHKKFKACPGDIVFLAKKLPYKILVGEEKYEFIYCDFEFFEDGRTMPKSDVFTPKIPVDSLFEDMFINFRKCIFYTSLIKLYEILQIIVDSQEKPVTTSKSRENVTKALEYINENINNPTLSVAMLCANTDMSETYFRRQFKELVGITPLEYITKKRIELAKYYLNSPFLTIEECATLCGFSTAQYFSRVFYMETGKKPLQYRRLED